MMETYQALYPLSFLPLINSYVASVAAEAKACHSELIYRKKDNTSLEGYLLDAVVYTVTESSRLSTLYQMHIFKWMSEINDSNYQDHQNELEELAAGISKLVSINQSIVAAIQGNQDSQ